MTDGECRGAAPRLSVIIPCFNAAGTLGEQLEALASQQWDGSWELLVVDNGSTDHTHRLVEQYRSRFRQLRLVLATAKRGAAHARNQGAKAARGKFLAFVDADDVVAPGWLAALARALDMHDFVACRLEYHKLNPPAVLSMRGGGQDKGLQIYDYPPFLPHAASAGLAVQRTLHERIGGFDEDMRQLEDTDYCWRLQLAGVSLQFAADAVVHYRYRPSLRGACRQARSWAEYNVKLYKRYRVLGMPALSWRRGWRNWKRLLRTSPRLGKPAERARWLWEFNWCLGRLYGCVKYRVLAP